MAAAPDLSSCIRTRVVDAPGRLRLRRLDVAVAPTLGAPIFTGRRCSRASARSRRTSILRRRAMHVDIAAADVDDNTIRRPPWFGARCGTAPPHGRGDAVETSRSWPLHGRRRFRQRVADPLRFVAGFRRGVAPKRSPRSSAQLTRRGSVPLILLLRGLGVSLAVGKRSPSRATCATTRREIKVPGRVRPCLRPHSARLGRDGWNSQKSVRARPEQTGDVILPPRQFGGAQQQRRSTEAKLTSSLGRRL